MKLKIKGIKNGDIYSIEDKYDRYKAIYTAIMKTGAVDSTTAKNILKLASYRNFPYFYDIIDEVEEILNLFAAKDGSYLPSNDMDDDCKQEFDYIDTL